MNQTDKLDKVKQQLNEMLKDDKKKGMFRKSDGKLNQANLEHEVVIRRQVLEYVLTLLDSD